MEADRSVRITADRAEPLSEDDIEDVRRRSAGV
jgi:hypothetical protein